MEAPGSILCIPQKFTLGELKTQRQDEDRQTKKGKEARGMHTGGSDIRLGCSTGRERCMALWEHTVGRVTRTGVTKAQGSSGEGTVETESLISPSRDEHSHPEPVRSKLWASRTHQRAERLARSWASLPEPCSGDSGHQDRSTQNGLCWMEKQLG